MSWWDIIKVQQTLGDYGIGLSKPSISPEEAEIQSRQRLPESQSRSFKRLQERMPNKIPMETSNIAQQTLNTPETQQQQQQQQQTNTPAADSGDAGSDVGQTIGRIKQHLARNPQGAKGIKTLPIIEKLILASQNPTAYQQEVKDAVKQLKQLVPTAV